MRARRVPGPGGEGKWAYTRDAKTPHVKAAVDGRGRQCLCAEQYWFPPTAALVGQWHFCSPEQPEALLEASSFRDRAIEALRHLTPPDSRASHLGGYVHEDDHARRDWCCRCVRRSCIRDDRCRCASRRRRICKRWWPWGALHRASTANGASGSSHAAGACSLGATNAQPIGRPGAPKGSKQAGGGKKEPRCATKT